MTPIHRAWVGSRSRRFPLLTARPQVPGYYSQIELDDLNDSRASEGIGLDMKNSQRYFESRTIDEKDPLNKQKVRFVSPNCGVAAEYPRRSVSHKLLVN